MWNLSVLVLSVFNVPDGDKSTPTDLYVTLLVDNQKKTSMEYHDIQSANVTLKETFEFENVVPRDIVFQIWDSDYSFDDLLCFSSWDVSKHLIEKENGEGFESPEYTVSVPCLGHGDAEITFKLDLELPEELSYEENGDGWDGVCATGKQQSPVFYPELIEEGKTLATAEYNPRWQTPSKKKVKAVAELSDHGVQVSPKKSGDFGFLVFEGERYLVRQFHFHTPAEHCFEIDAPAGSECQRRDVEMHVVHTSFEPSKIKPAQKKEQAEEEVKYLVVGLTFNRLLPEEVDPFWRQLDSILDLSTRRNVINFEISSDVIKVALESLGDVSWVSYKGSLTTPPCTEGVTWISAQEFGIIPETFALEFEKWFDGNYRNLQDNRNPITFAQLSVFP